MDKEHQLARARYFEKGDEMLAVRIPEFAFSALEADSIISKMRRHKGVVLDLRDNPGGYVDTLDRLLGGLFENDLKIYDHIGRDSTKPVSVTGRHHDAFTGKFIVLIDSESASASQLFARVVQLERRGFVLGDRSSGSVMEAKRYPHEMYLDAGSLLCRIHYRRRSRHVRWQKPGAHGRRSRHRGRACSERLRQRMGVPAMAKAAKLLGVLLSPQEAGTMFPYEGPTRELGSGFPSTAPPDPWRLLATQETETQIPLAADVPEPRDGSSE